MASLQAIKGYKTNNLALSKHSEVVMFFEDILEKDIGQSQQIQE